MLLLVRGRHYLIIGTSGRHTHSLGSSILLLIRFSYHLCVPNAEGLVKNLYGKSSRLKIVMMLIMLPTLLSRPGTYRATLLVLLVGLGSSCVTGRLLLVVLPPPGRFGVASWQKFLPHKQLPGQAVSFNSSAVLLRILSLMTYCTGCG